MTNEMEKLFASAHAWK